MLSRFSQPFKNSFINGMSKTPTFAIVVHDKDLRTFVFKLTI